MDCWGWGMCADKLDAAASRCADSKGGVCVYRLTEMLSPPVTQLQMTLASVQELLIQQQQKVQELAHELATAKVLVPDPLVPQVQVRPSCPVHCVP